MQSRRFDAVIDIPSDDDDDEDDEDYEDDEDDEDDDGILWEFHPQAPHGRANQLPVHLVHEENDEDP